MKFCVCLDCIHLHDIKPGQESTCDAFPEGIPQPIIWGNHDHLTPFDGDNGIRFEQQPGPPMARAPKRQSRTRG